MVGQCTTHVFFSFMVITKMNFHFRRISDFSYISQDSSKKKKNLSILSFFINMSKRIVPSKKKKAQGPVDSQSLQVSPQVSPQVPPQGSSQSSSQVPPQGSSQGSSQVSSPSQVSKTSKTFEKIITQNAKILQKLDVLISSQKKIEERLEVPEINNEDLIKVSLFHCILFTYIPIN